MAEAPPPYARSKTVTDAPSSAAAIAAHIPARPLPITITSASLDRDSSIFSSSFAGDGDAAEVNPYTKYKAVAETLVFRANGPSLRTISIRVPGIYGEGHCAIIDQPITSMRKGQQNIQLGNNSKLFTFTYVGNAAHAHVLASHALLAVDDKTQTPKVDGEAFFVSDGVSKPFWDTCREILHEAGDRSPRQKIKVLPLLPMIIIAGVGEWLYWTFTLGTKAPAMRKMDIEFLAQGQVFSIDKAKARLHYEPLVTQQEGIRRAVKWALEHEEKVA